MSETIAGGTLRGDPSANRVFDFLNSVGVNTHTRSFNTGYGNLEHVIDQLKYLNAKHVRDAVQWDDDVPRLLHLAGATGAKLNAVIDGYQPSLEEQLSRVERLANIVTSIEGPNEVRWWPVTRDGLTGAAGAAEMQRDLYALVKASAVLHDKPVINLSTGEAVYDAVVGDLTPWADYANTHIYFPAGAPSPGAPTQWNGLPQVLDRAVDARLFAHDKPVIATEAGYSSAPHHPQGVSEEVQARYDQRLLLENWQTAGIKETYFFQLMAESTDNSGQSYEAGLSLFRYDGTAKPAAVAIHNLTTVLVDHGADAASFNPGTLDYSLGSMPSTAKDLLLQRSDGSFLIVLWNEVDNWDEDADRSVAVPDAPVTLSFGSGGHAVRVYDTLRGTDPMVVYDGLSQVSLNVPDHALVVEVSGGRNDYLLA